MLVRHELVFVLLSVVLPATQGVDFCATSWNPLQKAIIDSDQVIPVSQLKGIILYFCQQRDINIQLWKRVTPTTYSLERQYLMTGPPEVPNTFKVDLGETITITSEHRLGLFFSENRDVPVSLEFKPSGTQIISQNVLSSYSQGSSYEFINLPYPYEVHLAGCAMSDCLDQSGNFPLPFDPTALPPSVDCDVGELIGDENKAIMQQNVLYAAMTVRSVVAYFCTDYDVTLQVWQPAGGDTYTLVHSVPLVKPPGHKPGEKSIINLLKSDSFYITEDQRIGLYQGASTGQFIPIITVSDITSPEYITFAKTEGPYGSLRDYEFDNLQMPRKFLLTLCANENCEKPATTTTTTPIASNTTTTSTTTTTTTSTTTTSGGLPGISSSFSPVSPSGPSSVTGYTTDFAMLPGFPGDKGFKGRRGLTGLQGQTGDAGVPGSHNSITGIKGAKGDLGVGNKGQQGQTGEPGRDSVRGGVGDKGIVGQVGPPGPVGSPGEQGPDPFVNPGPKTGELKEGACECDGLMDKKVVLGLLIWAIILTVITLALIIMATRTTSPKRS